MKYVSTAGPAPVLEFADVLLAGLARDGGLYVPEAWPELAADALAALRRPRPTPTSPSRSCGPSSRAASSRDDVRGRWSTTPTRTFDDPDVVPARATLGDGLWLLELFHGPTLAFKDVALQLVGRLFDHELTRRGERVTIVGATSGDTGSAAIEACRGPRRASTSSCCTRPAGCRDVQRRQMTTVDAPNVHNVAVEGTFDDCQDLVKALFADEAFRDRRQPVGRELDQLGPGDGPDRLLRRRAAARLAGGRRPCRSRCRPATSATCSPARCAQRMGAADRASSSSARNRNDILTRFLADRRDGR